MGIVAAVLASLTRCQSQGQVCRYKVAAALGGTFLESSLPMGLSTSWSIGFIDGGGDVVLSDRGKGLSDLQPDFHPSWLWK